MPLKVKRLGSSHLIRYGNNAQISEYTGSKGEISYNTENNDLVVHNGSTAGGFLVGSGAYSNAVSYTDTLIGTANTAMVANAASAYSNAISQITTTISNADLDAGNF